MNRRSEGATTNNQNKKTEGDPMTSEQQQQPTIEGKKFLRALTLASMIGSLSVVEAQSHNTLDNLKVLANAEDDERFTDDERGALKFLAVKLEDFMAELDRVATEVFTRNMNEIKNPRTPPTSFRTSNRRKASGGSNEQQPEPTKA